VDSEVAFVFLLLLITAGFAFTWTPLGRALAERVRARPAAPGTDELSATSQELVREIERLRADVTDLSERVDFAERLLARQREAERLAPPR
jgi:hypothetical protein